jgi:hypothetical protein
MREADELNEQPLNLPGVDVRELVPDAESEAIKAIKDQIGDERPLSFLGVLIDRQRPMEVVTIAGLIGEKVDQVDWIAEVLEEEGLCRRFDDDGIQMVELVADSEQATVA